MIKAKHSRIWSNFFNLYTCVNLRLHFSEVHLPEFPSPASPVLLLGNHFSWWDGFFLLYLNRKILGKKFHIMMLEGELKKRMILRGTGAFSIRKGSKSAFRTLDYTTELLKVPDNLVVVFPQGKIQSQKIEKVEFETGFARILSNLPEKSEIVFSNCFTEYYSNKKPALYIFLQQYSGIRNLEKTESAFNQFLKLNKAHLLTLT